LPLRLFKAFGNRVGLAAFETKDCGDACLRGEPDVSLSRLVSIVRGGDGAGFRGAIKGKVAAMHLAMARKSPWAMP
jgi:hypothetical protein